MDTDLMLTPMQAAERLGVTVRTVYHATMFRGLPKHHVGRAILLDPEEVDAWREEHRARRRTPRTSQP